MDVPSVSLDRSMFARFDDSVKKEWLITNGLGGYASSTIVGLNTRKYHGLLVAAIHPPHDRRVFLQKLDEDLISEGQTYRLGTNEFSDTLFPTGYEFLQQVVIDPFPTFIYKVNEVTVRKTIFMPDLKNCAIALYSVSNMTQSEVKMRVFPLVNWRSLHQVTDKSNVSAPTQTSETCSTKLNLSRPKATLMIRSTEGEYRSEGKWTEKLFLREEAARGESCLDDCYQLGRFEFSSKPQTNRDIAIVAVADEDDHRAEEIMKSVPATAAGIISLFEREINERLKLLDSFYGLHRVIRATDWLSWLVLTADSFIVRDFSTKEKSVIAGYHWFGVWGRDTFVSLPGLLLVSGRFGEAREVFLSFARRVKGGLIPNFLSEDSDSCAYNTVDATLWFAYSVMQYLKYTGDFAFVRKTLWETLKQILDNHKNGTSFGIHVDVDGLLSHGFQLTWMDSSIQSRPASPRAGKAVEVQALWYNMLRTVQLLAAEFDEKKVAEEAEFLSELARKSFVKKFWNSQKGCLHDTVSESGVDDSLRPNQIIVASLDFSLLDAERNQQTTSVVRNELLTPFGLRTLSKKDPRYIGVYSGDRSLRDKAYHFGTVWPWLLGPFTKAYLKVHDYDSDERDQAFSNFLTRLFTSHIYDAGIGTVSEIFDGDAPHTPRGCISQAWSVAEPLRAYVEDVLFIRPRYEKEVLSKLG